MLKIKSAFSLIELMVVIAVVAVLSAAAIPAYKTYMIKTKIVAAMSILGKLTTEIKQARITNPASSSLNFLGASRAGTGTWGDINAPNVQKFYYYNSMPSYDGVCIYIYGLEGIPSYSQPVNGQDGTYTRVCAHINHGSNEVDRITCGRWTATSNTLDIPLEYLPASCNCASLSSGTC